MSELALTLLIANVVLFFHVFWLEPEISNWLWRNGYRSNVRGIWDAAKNGFKTLPDSPNGALERAHEAHRQMMAKIYELDEKRLAK